LFVLDRDGDLRGRRNGDHTTEGGRADTSSGAPLLPGHAGRKPCPT
jgi:hypothetical protein